MENNKEMVKNELKETIDRLYKEYPNTPPSYVTDEELDDLLNVVEAHFLANGMMDEYRSAMNIIIRRALYYSAVQNKDGFIINHLAMAMKDLAAYHIPNDEIKAMQEELFEKSFKRIK